MRCKRPFDRNGIRRRSVAVAASAPFVVQTDADDVVGVPEALAVVCGDERAKAGGGHGGASRLLRLAEVDIEIFELRAPAVAVRKDPRTDQQARP